MISPNGIAHIQLTVRDVGASRPFYHRMLVETFGMSIQYDVPNQIFYCIGARMILAPKSRMDVCSASTSSRERRRKQKWCRPTRH